MSNEGVRSIAILGRQPALGIAELESLYGAESVLPFSEDACLFTMPTEQINFTRLGGSMRLARVLATLPSTNWNDIERELVKMAPAHAERVTGKLSFGISVYGIKTTGRAVARTALMVKKAIRSSGHSVRMVPHKDLTLGSATVLNNKLVKGGWELLVISDGTTTYLAQTTNIQDIDAYAARDQARPMRDAKVGMLPPKLAQVLINVAVGQVESREFRVESLEEPQALQIPRSSDGAQQDSRLQTLILDPFCGTGVLLQEAMLMDYAIYGTDIEPRMIEYSEANLKWLAEKWKLETGKWKLQAADATKHQWELSKLQTPDSRLTVATETFLGHPLSTLPSGEHLSKIIYEANVINHRFLQNIATQLKPGARLALGVPAWKGKHEFLHLPLLDHLTDMGYTRVRFTHASNDDLIYHRENQIVGRELLVLVKN